MTDAPDKAGNQQDRTGRDARGRFRRGHSGNAAGRRRGSRNKAAIALDELGEKYGQIVLSALIRKAVSGDTIAARVILDRLWPPPKGRRVAIRLPAITDASSALAAVAEVTRAVATAELTASEGADLVSLITNAAKIVEAVAIERRVSELESKIGIGKDDHETVTTPRSH